MIARSSNGKNGPRGKGQVCKPSMPDHGKSDAPVVHAKVPNKAVSSAAKVVEERGPAKRNTAGKTDPRHSAGLNLSNALDCVRQADYRHHSRQEPSALNARWDLCGGLLVRVVPTAIPFSS